MRGNRKTIIRQAAEAYGRGDYDRYEALVERGASMGEAYPGQFEDAVTDLRLLGAGRD